MPRMSRGKTLVFVAAFSVSINDYVTATVVECSVDYCWLLVGVKLSEVYSAAVSTVEDERPQLVDKMTKSAGFVSLYTCLTGWP